MTIGIDPGVLNLGVCVLTSWSIHQSFKEHLQVLRPGQRKDGERLQFLTEQTEAFITPHVHFAFQNEWNVQAAMEGYDYKGFGTLQLAEISGCIKALMAKLNVPLLILSPSQVKKFAVGNAQADKTAMMTRYKIDNEHLADARALAGCAAVYVTGLTTFRHELEVVKTLKTPKKKKKKCKKMTSLAL